MSNEVTDIFQSRRALLVEALRSGEYQQISGQLHTEDGYCCLGVACEISKQGNWEHAGGSIHYNTPRNSQNSYMPNDVTDYFGFYDRTGSYMINEGEYTSLVDLNDNGVPFEEIANIIEACDDKKYNMFRWEE